MRASLLAYCVCIGLVSSLVCVHARAYGFEDVQQDQAEVNATSEERFKRETVQDRGLLMQQFIIDISKYARSIRSKFIIAPQNGLQLAFKDLDEKKGLSAPILRAVDAFGVEELFYNGKLSVDDTKVQWARKIRTALPVFNADYVKSDGNVNDAVKRNQKENFVGFPRTRNNYDYEEIPKNIVNRNQKNIPNLQAVKNYLYLISSDKYKSKQDMLKAVRDTDYDLIVLDAFFEGKAFTADDIKSLKQKKGGGSRLVLGYLNVGSAEKFRYYWQKGWKVGNPSWLNQKYAGYADEIWVKFWSKEWRQIIFGNNNSYVKKLIDAGFDGAYLDNVEVL